MSSTLLTAALKAGKRPEWRRRVREVQSDRRASESSRKSDKIFDLIDEVALRSTDFDILVPELDKNVPCWSILASLNVIKICLMEGTAKCLRWARRNRTLWIRCVGFDCSPSCTFQNENKIQHLAQDILNYLDQRAEDRPGDFLHDMDVPDITDPAQDDPASRNFEHRSRILPHEDDRKVSLTPSPSTDSNIETHGTTHDEFYSQFIRSYFPGTATSEQSNIPVRHNIPPISKSSKPGLTQHGQVPVAHLTRELSNTSLAPKGRQEEVMMKELEPKLEIPSRVRVRRNAGESWGTWGTYPREAHVMEPSQEDRESQVKDTTDVEDDWGKWGTKKTCKAHVIKPDQKDSGVQVEETTNIEDGWGNWGSALRKTQTVKNGEKAHLDSSKIVENSSQTDQADRNTSEGLGTVWGVNTRKINKVSSKQAENPSVDSESTVKPLPEAEVPNDGQERSKDSEHRLALNEVNGKNKILAMSLQASTLSRGGATIAAAGGLHGRLNTFFPSRDQPGSYSDDDINQISLLLTHISPRWSKVPRCYIVLRIIGSLDVLDDCISIGFSDYWLPATERNLPDCMRPSVKMAFIKAQDTILTKALGLERGAKGQHCHFRKGETTPFETKAILGSGGYGQVDRILSLVSYKEYARKRVLRSVAFRGRKKEDVQQFILEIEILKRLSHFHVVEFVGSYTDSKYVALIMSPVADADLTTYMSQVTPTKFAELRTFFGCLATGLEYLHANNIRHKDIKPSNVVINAGNVLFVDFGLSLDFTDATNSTTMSMVNGMTPRYCAPEVAAQSPRNTKSDIWSLGIVFLEMIATLKDVSLAKIDEFLAQRGTEQKFLRLNFSVLPELLAYLAGFGQLNDNVVLAWVGQMLSEDQKLRPTASDLVTFITSASYEGSGVSFCGICCMEPDEEDFSDCASD